MKPDTGNEPMQSWRSLYETAVLELDDTRVLQRISDAQHAIMDRLEDLNRGGDTAEGQELSNALLVLGDLHRINGAKSHPKAA